MVKFTWSLFAEEQDRLEVKTNNKRNGYMWDDPQYNEDAVFTFDDVDEIKIETIHKEACKRFKELLESEGQYQSLDEVISEGVSFPEHSLHLIKYLYGKYGERMTVHEVYMYFQQQRNQVGKYKDSMWMDFYYGIDPMKNTVQWENNLQYLTDEELEEITEKEYHGNWANYALKNEPCHKCGVLSFSIVEVASKILKIKWS